MKITHRSVEWGFLNPRRPPPEVLREFSLFKEFDIAGEFWRPSYENERIPGQLFIIPGGSVHLSLMGSFENGPKKKTSYPILNGRLATGVPCTLIDIWGHVDAYGMNPASYITQLHCDFFIVGGEFSKEEDINVDFLDIHFSHVEKWFKPPYDLVINRDSSEHLMCFQPDEAQANITWKEKQCKLNVFCSRTVPLGVGHRETKFNYAYRFHLSSKEKYHFSWFLEVASVLRECFMYLIGTGIYTLEIKMAENFNEESDSESHSEPKQYMIYFGVDVPSYIRTDSSLYCTRYDKLKDLFSGFIERWFENRSKLDVVVSSYKEILLNDGAYEDSLFLRIVQTLEHFHGIVFDKANKYCSKTEWKAFVDWFQKNTPEPDKTDLDIPLEKLESLREITLNRLSGLNSLTLRSRLENLFDGVQSGCLWPAIGNPDEPRQHIKEIIQEIEDTRNYLTHYRQKLKSKRAVDRDLERNTALLWGLMAYWVGKFLKLPETELDEIAFKSTHAMFLTGRRTKL